MWVLDRLIKCLGFFVWEGVIWVRVRWECGWFVNGYSIDWFIVGLDKRGMSEWMSERAGYC